MFHSFLKHFPSVSRETLEKIERYYRLLINWNQKINLVDKKTLVDFEVRHLIDSWQLSLCMQSNIKTLDMGSGAGLPGIILSIAGFDIDVCEIDKNKASFLKVCKYELNLPCKIITDDIHQLDKTHYSAFTSRAFSSLSTLIELTYDVSRETQGAFLKGEKVEDEIKEAQKKWDFSYEKVSSFTSEKGCIMIIKNIKPRNH